MVQLLIIIIIYLNTYLVIKIDSNSTLVITILTTYVH